jgi:hypothetical protein
MSRNKTNTAEFFPHRVNHGKTMFKLEAKYSNDGYAFLFKLCEMLGAAENHYLDLSDTGDWDFFVIKMRISEEKCTAILADLVAWNKLDKELYEDHKIVWYEKFVQGLSQLYLNRRRELPVKPHFYSRKDSETTQSTTESTQSRVEESKGEIAGAVAPPFDLEIKPEKPKKAKAPKQPKKEEPKDAGWQLWVDAYYKFLQNRLGTKPLLNKSDFAGLRDIRQQLQEGNEKDDTKALSEFLYILQHWAKLENYHQNRVKAVQINSELLNIQLQIRKATGMVTKNGITAMPEPQQEMTAEEVNDLFAMKPDTEVYTPKFKFST